MNFQPSLVRQALDELLRLYPHLDLVDVDWGLTLQPVEGPSVVHALVDPWVVIKLGQPSETFAAHPAWVIHHFAIWKATGALYTMSDGAVSDDPVWTP